MATEDALPCSALISVMTTAGTGAEAGGALANDRSQAVVADVYAAQATWRSYYAMLRIYKTYSFEYYPQKVLTIASSPGLLHSKDDFLASPTLVVMETTNMVANATMRVRSAGNRPSLPFPPRPHTAFPPVFLCRSLLAVRLLPSQRTVICLALPCLQQWNVEHSNMTVLSWQRSMVATGWAGSGKAWVDTFSKFNSGALSVRDSNLGHQLSLCLAS